jgi:hypothetical protein
MTLDEIKKARDELARRVSAIIAKRKDHFTFDAAAVKALRQLSRDYHRQIPLGTTGYIREKFGQLIEDAEFCLKDNKMDVSRLQTGIARIDIAMQSLEKRPNSPSTSTE